VTAHKPLNEVQHKKDEERISRKSASKKEILENDVANWSLRIIGKIANHRQVQKKHETEKIEGGANRLAHVRQKFSEGHQGSLNSLTILDRIQPAR
jgi:hypothetical protein